MIIAIRTFILKLGSIILVIIIWYIFCHRKCILFHYFYVELQMDNNNDHYVRTVPDVFLDVCSQVLRLYAVSAYGKDLKTSEMQNYKQKLKCSGKTIRPNEDSP